MHHFGIQSTGQTSHCLSTMLGNRNDSLCCFCLFSLFPVVSTYRGRTEQPPSEDHRVETRVFLLRIPVFFPSANFSCNVPAPTLNSYSRNWMLNPLSCSCQHFAHKNHRFRTVFGTRNKEPPKRTFSSTPETSRETLGHNNVSS